MARQEPSDAPRRIDLTLSPEQAGPEGLRRALARRLGRDEATLGPYHVVRRSLDARGGRVRFHLWVELAPPPEAPPSGPPPRPVVAVDRVLVVGDGPAGLFCAYELARHGIGCTVLERGQPVRPRRRALAAVNRRGQVPADSNYCFGEGGAGTYSDGKLYTRAKKRGPVRDVLGILAAHGAPADILVDARPHIGSNRLPKVVTALREHLESVGVRFRFGARVAGLLREPGGRVRGVRLASGETLAAEAVVLATGHSARDVYRFLHEAGVRLQPKPFAMGVRVEHPQALVDRAQYGRWAGHPALPAASYRLTTQLGAGRGAFSFCMCPGGWIVPAATEPDGVVLNGMSLTKRAGPFANSGIVVTVSPADWVAAGYEETLGGVHLQRRIERAAFEAGGGALVAPAQRIADLLAGRPSADVPEGSYVPGYRAADVGEVLDAGGVSLAAPLREALARFDRRLRGFASREAVAVAVESRTSSPVRVLREPDSLQAPGAEGLYPCGEGAGYAGGIVSAALDGMRVARRLADALGSGR